MQVLLHILGGLLIAASVVGLLSALVLGLQTLLAVTSSRRTTTSTDAGQPRPRVAILMPAHNEAGGITGPVRSAAALLQPQDRLLVVADNCSDDTASVAEAAGAEVVQRHDPTRRGKGFALDFGVRHLVPDPPEIVIIVDADCQMEADAVDSLARRCAQLDRPVQALYLMHSPPGAGMKLRMAELAWIVKNQVRPLGFACIGLPCQLMGTGMAFPWAQLSRAQLATGSIVEDMQLGLELAGEGHAPAFLHEARVTSMFPSNLEGLQAQRTRWEHGHLTLMFGLAPRLMWRAIATGQPMLAAMVVDLCVPPLASLVLGLVAIALASAMMSLLGASPLPWALSASALLLVFVSILGAWARFGRAIVSLRELLLAPTYALRKIPMYFKLLRNRQTDWVRTKRDDADR